MKHFATLILSVVVALAVVNDSHAQNICVNGTCTIQPQYIAPTPTLATPQPQPRFVPATGYRAVRPRIGPDGQTYLVYIRGYFRGFGLFGQRVWVKQ